MQDLGGGARAHARRVGAACYLVELVHPSPAGGLCTTTLDFRGGASTRLKSPDPLDVVGEVRCPACGARGEILRGRWIASPRLGTFSPRVVGPPARGGGFA